MRFTEEPPSAGAPSHVHFEEKLHDSVVMVTPEEDGNFMVKVRCRTSRPRPDESGRLFHIDLEKNQNSKAEPESCNTRSNSLRTEAARGNLAVHPCQRTTSSKPFTCGHCQHSTVPSLILGGGGFYGNHQGSVQRDKRGGGSVCGTAAVCTQIQEVMEVIWLFDCLCVFRQASMNLNVFFIFN